MPTNTTWPTSGPRVTQPDGGAWAYGYDALWQVTSGAKHWSDGTAEAAEQFSSTFDTIGNRTARAAGGDAAGANLRTTAYTVNALNEYASRTVPGGADVVGAVPARATVTVNGRSPYRHGAYFRQELTGLNAGGTAWASVAMSEQGADGTVNGRNGYLFVPASPETYFYDADRNLTSDGRWTNTWDGENRLVRMTAATSVGLRLALCDGDGNLAGTVDAAAGTLTAWCEYGPVGELLRATRDPAEEEDGSPNLYAFLANAPVDDSDFLGLFDIYVHHDGFGHAAITDKTGINYDYCRYRVTYGGGGGLHAGANILVRSSGWPPQNKAHSFVVFHFAVCPELDRAMNQSLAQQVAQGKNTWPPDVLKKLEPTRPTAG